MRHFKEVPPFAEAFVLPRSVKLTGGATSDELRHRLEEALHGDVQAAVRGLTEAVTARRGRWTPSWPSGSTPSGGGVTATAG